MIFVDAQEGRRQKIKGDGTQIRRKIVCKRKCNIIKTIRRLTAFVCNENGRLKS